MNAPPKHLAAESRESGGLSLERKTQVGFASALICLGVIGIVSYFTISRVRGDAEWVGHTKEVISALRLLLADVTGVESAQRGFAIVADENFLERYKLERREIGVDLQSLRELTADNAAQQRRLDMLAPLIAKRMVRLDDEVELRRGQDFVAAQAATATGVGWKLHDEIQKLVVEMEAVEQGLLQRREVDSKRSSEAAKAIIVAGSLLALAVIAVALFAVGKDFGRRRTYLAQATLAARLARLGAWEIALPEFEVTWSDEICVLHEVPLGFSPTLEQGINFYAPESRGAIQYAIEACTRDGTTFDLELQLVTAKGRRIWVRAIGESERDAKGVIRRVQGAFQDITARKDAERQLQSSEARYRSLFEDAPDGIVIADPGGTYLDANASICRMLGYTRDELTGLNAADIVVPTETPNIEPALSTIKAKSDYHREWRFRRKDGSDFDAEVIATLMPDGNLLGMIRDISGRKQAEESLRLLHSAVLQSRESVLITDAMLDPPGPRIVFANPAFTLMTGYSAGEVIGKTPRILQGPHTDRAVLDRLRRNLERGEVFEGEAINYGKDGNEFYLEWQVAPLRDAGGKVTHFVAVQRDITERKEGDDALLRQQTELRVLFDLMPAMIWFKDANNRILRINQRAADAAGKSIAEIEGKSAFEIYPRESAKFYADDLVVMRSGTAKLGIVAMMVDREGKETWVQTDKVPVFDREGTVSGIVVMAQDITAQKQGQEALHESETQFRQVVENIDEVFWIMDPMKNVMLYVSPAYAEIWGRTCESLYADQRTWLESVHPEDRERVGQARVARYTGGNYDESFRIMRPDGTMRWIHSRAFPVHDKMDEVHRVVGICEDITKYRSMEEQFRQAQKMEAIGTLAGGIAHDFNNVLAAINGYTELSLLTMKEDPEVRGFLDAVLKASSRAADLIRQILMFSRQQPLERLPIRLHSIVAECIALLRATLPTTIEFDTSLATDAPMVLGDATQIHQVLMNLGTNAWHAMKDHPGRLQLRLEKCVVDAAYAATHPQLRMGVYARISVSDTGSGMDQAQLRRIFEPFYTTKPVGEGTGLGLAVVHGIMDSHDGVITVYSQPGEGTVFHLYFPAHAGEATAPAIAEETAPRGHGESVLFVDDEELLALLGQKTLAALGYEVECTTQPAAALAMVRANPSRFALVLTDQTMPVMTGLTLATLLREVRPGLRIILTTGYGLSLTPERLAAHGIHQLLLKPTTLHSLATAVNSALHPKAPSQ
jgi:PAS domain S-box-containing protein